MDDFVFQGEINPVVFYFYQGIQDDSSPWTEHLYYDISDTVAGEEMSASDLEAVKVTVEQKKYNGFSVFNGRAYLKRTKTEISKEDLIFQGEQSRVVFHLYRLSVANQLKRCTS